MDAITVYTKPECVQCTAVFRVLDKAGVTYRKVDISSDSEARDYVMSHLGYLQAPWSTPAPTTTSADSGRTGS
jgi:glutaredoxin-like protein NrdH